MWSLSKWTNQTAALINDNHQNISNIQNSTIYHNITWYEELWM